MKNIIKNIPVKLNQELILKIDNYGHEGEGVGRHQDFTIFVKGALQNELVKVKITEIRKNFARGLILEIIEPSSDRTTTPCVWATSCGGCQLQHLEYHAQLAFKEQIVQNALARIGGLAEIKINPIIDMKNPWSYRNKAQYPWGVSENLPVVGFYQHGTHQIIPHTNCLIQNYTNNKIIAKVLELVRKYQLSIYQETTNTGFLRHTLIRSNQNATELMVVLVTNGENFPAGKKLATELSAAFPEIKSILQNINTKPGNVILGAKTRLLWGQEYIVDQLNGLKFQISAKSFFQVNPTQTEILYQQAIQAASLTGQETILDAYCGVGSISLHLAQAATKVYGIEVVPEAIENAITNATLNQLHNLEFLVGEVEKVLPDLIERGVNFDVAVVDPPRSGCAASVLESFHAAKIPRIIYVSCNPSTLARDLKILTEFGYQIKLVQLVDMFPQTYHVECVVLVERSLIP